MNKNEAISFFKDEKRALEIFHHDNLKTYSEAGGNNRMMAIDYALAALDLLPDDFTLDTASTTRDVTMDELKDMIRDKQGDFVINVELGGE